MIGLVWAQAPGRVLALNGELPWDVPEDFAHFRACVRGHGVIMGRATWDSLPESLHPMPESPTVVITRDETWEHKGAQRASSITEALEMLAGNEEIWIAGGGQIYTQCVEYADLAVVTEIDVELPDLTDEDVTLAPALQGEWQVKEIAEDHAWAPGWRTSRTGTRWSVTVYEKD